MKFYSHPNFALIDVCYCTWDLIILYAQYVQRGTWTTERAGHIVLGARDPDMHSSMTVGRDFMWPQVLGMRF